MWWFFQDSAEVDLLLASRNSQSTHVRSIRHATIKNASHSSSRFWSGYLLPPLAWIIKPQSLLWGLIQNFIPFQLTNLFNCSLKGILFSSTVLNSTAQKGKEEEGIKLEENLLSVTGSTAWPSAGGWYAEIAAGLTAMEAIQSSNCFRVHKQGLHSWHWNAADGWGESWR